MILMDSELFLLYKLKKVQVGRFVATFIRLNLYSHVRLWSEFPDVKTAFHIPLYVIYCETAFDTEIDSFAKNVVNNMFEKCNHIWLWNKKPIQYFSSRISVSSQYYVCLMMPIRYFSSRISVSSQYYVSLMMAITFGFGIKSRFDISPFALVLLCNITFV